MAPLGFIAIPKVYWAHTRERVNVQDFIDGVPGNHLEALTPGRVLNARCSPNAAPTPCSR